VILDALATAGILPNGHRAPPTDQWITRQGEEEASSATPTHGHSDIDWPQAGWRGKLGVEWQRAEAWLGVRRKR
jgi:hypothetical protein